jgi:hypothetical protein
MAKVIVAPEIYDQKDTEFSLFLGGGITDCPDWQAELIELLKDAPDLVMYNPRRENFPIHDPNASKEQITWEHDYLQEVDILVFWFAKGSLNPIVLYELGRYGNSSERMLFIGMDKEYKRQQDVLIQTELDRPEVEVVYSLEDLSIQILNGLKLLK